MILVIQKVSFIILWKYKTIACCDNNLFCLISHKIGESKWLGSQEIRFEFVVHNRETTDYRYVYVVVVNINGTKHIIDSKNVLVKNGKSYVKSEKVEIKDKADTQEIVVELLNKHQSIDIWMGN